MWTQKTVLETKRAILATQGFKKQKENGKTHQSLKIETFENLKIETFETLSWLIELESQKSQF